MTTTRYSCAAVALASLAALTALAAAPRAARAQEQWCTDHTASCVCSEPLGAPSYTGHAGGGYISADDANPKKCTWSPSNPGWSIWAASGTPPTRKADPAVLALMPNRDASKVTSYVGTDDGVVDSWMVGNEGTDLTNAARVVFRFYLFRSSNYQFANQGGCTNGKTAEVIASGFQGSEIIFTSDGAANKAYGFVDATWGWGGAATFDGWTHGPDGADGDPGSQYTVGKWTRHEIVVTQPRADQQGTTLEWWITDVSGGGTPKQVVKTSNPCTSCMIRDGATGSNWAWDTSVHPKNDLVDFAANMYRAGTCAGYNALSHYVLATFDTDAGQMIGPAVEVEGPAAPAPRAPPAAPTGLTVQ